MAFDDRITYLLLGMLIGFVLGRFSRLEKNVTDIKEELDEVDEILKGEKHLEHQEPETPEPEKSKGVQLKKPKLGTVALLIVILLSAWASFASQKASNNSSDNQDRLESLITCNTQVLNALVDATNDRTTYSGQQIKANVDLQTSFKGLLGILLHKPPFSESRNSKAVLGYYDDLGNFVEVSKKSVRQVTQNPYPEKDALAQCVGDAKKHN